MKTGKLFKGVLLFAVLILMSCATSKNAERSSFDAKQGKIYVKKLKGVKIHTYTTPIPMAAGASHIIETKNYLVMVDTLQNRQHNEELKMFVDSLGKPINRIYVSHDHPHHWVGLEMFPGVPVYALNETIEVNIREGYGELKKLKMKFGEDKIPYEKVVVPQNVVEPGDEAIDGVLFRFSNPKPKVLGNVLFIELPKQKAIIHHHLAYVGIHAPMKPIPPRIEMLKEFKTKNYTWVMGGHGIPTDNDTFVDTTIQYYLTAQKVIEESPDAKTAKEKLIKEYPDYGGVFLLDIMLPRYYKDK